MLKVYVVLIVGIVVGMYAESLLQQTHHDETIAAGEKIGRIRQCKNVYDDFNSKKFPLCQDYLKWEKQDCDYDIDHFIHDERRRDLSK